MPTNLDDSGALVPRYAKSHTHTFPAKGVGQPKSQQPNTKYNCCLLPSARRLKTSSDFKKLLFRMHALSTHQHLMPPGIRR